MATVSITPSWPHFESQDSFEYNAYEKCKNQTSAASQWAISMYRSGR